MLRRRTGLIWSPGKLHINKGAVCKETDCTPENCDLYSRASRWSKNTSSCDFCTGKSSRWVSQTFCMKSSYVQQSFSFQLTSAQTLSIHNCVSSLTVGWASCVCYQRLNETFSVRNVSVLTTATGFLFTVLIPCSWDVKCKESRMQSFANLKKQHNEQKTEEMFTFYNFMKMFVPFEFYGSFSKKKQTNYTYIQRHNFRTRSRSLKQWRQ